MFFHAFSCYVHDHFSSFWLESFWHCVHSILFAFLCVCVYANWWNEWTKIDLQLDEWPKWICMRKRCNVKKSSTFVSPLSIVPNRFEQFIVSSSFLRGCCRQTSFFFFSFFSCTLLTLHWQNMSTTSLWLVTRWNERIVCATRFDSLDETEKHLKFNSIIVFFVFSVYCYRRA